MLFGPFWCVASSYPTDGLKVKCFRSMVCILDIGLAIWEVLFDKFIRGSFVPLNIDGCIDERETT